MDGVEDGLLPRDDGAPFESEGSEVHQKADRKSGDFEVVQGLGQMLRSERPDGLQLDDEFAVHDQVAEVLARTEAVDVENMEGLLVFDLVSGLFKAVSTRIFVNLFQQADPKVFMNPVGDLPDGGR